MQPERLHVRLRGFSGPYHFAELDELGRSYSCLRVGPTVAELEAAASRLGRRSIANATMRSDDGYEYRSYSFDVDQGTMIILVPDPKDLKACARSIVVFTAGRFTNGCDTIHDFVDRFVRAAYGEEVSAKPPVVRPRKQPGRRPIAAAAGVGLLVLIYFGPYLIG